MEYALCLFKVTNKMRSPYSDNTNSADLHIGILGLVQAHSFALSVIWRWITCGISMPVITVKLNDEIERWDKGIYTELAIDKVLWNEVNPSFLQKIIAYLLRLSALTLLQFLVHCNKALPVFWIGVSASDGTILDIRSLCPTWRPRKFCATRFTSKLVSIASLPCYLVFQAAKVSRCAINALFRQVKVNPAILTGYVFSIASFSTPVLI